jgi:hypothetical protein
MSYTLTQTQNFCSGFLQGIPTSSWTGSEPILSTAGAIRSTMLQAPFQWSWNRANVPPITTQAGVSDYATSLTDFGYLETGTVGDGTTLWEFVGSGMSGGVKNNTPLAMSTTQGRPSVVALQSQVPNVSQVFRLSAVPNTAYTVNLIYQIRPALFANLSANWAPVPDELVVQIANYGVLAELLFYAGEGSFMQYRQRFVAGLLAVSEGLTEEEKALFSESYLRTGISAVASQQRSAQGTQGRSA